MRIAFIGRSTLFEVPGGDTIQITATAAWLNRLGVKAKVFLRHQLIREKDFDLFHFFNITRPADILAVRKGSVKPYVLSPVYVKYEAYDRQVRAGFSGKLFRIAGSSRAEYLKTVFRALKGNDLFPGWNYLLHGQQQSIRKILSGASLLLPNSASEWQALQKDFGVYTACRIIPNGVDPLLFSSSSAVQKEEKLVLCAARIEGIKNQLHLIRALNRLDVQVLLIGSPAPNQPAYYEQCRKEAADNIRFIGQLSQDALISYYARAKVHVLPSWFETCGLSSLEAAAMGCNIVITNKGYTRDYFGTDAFYCDPADPSSIREAVLKALAAETPQALTERVHQQFTWEQAATQTLEAYQQIFR